MAAMSEVPNWIRGVRDVRDENGEREQALSRLTQMNAIFEPKFPCPSSVM